MSASPCTKGTEGQGGSTKCCPVRVWMGSRAGVVAESLRRVRRSCEGLRRRAGSQQGPLQLKRK